MENVIKEWKEKNVSYANFEFSCGGDSMNETTLTFYDENENLIEVSGDMERYFDNEVYSRVQFYEASDGHYMGESGNVRIELDEEEEDFYFMKSAQSESSEIKTEIILVPLTKEEKEFIDTYILSMGASNWEGDFINYKKDFILSEDKSNILKGITTKFDNYSRKIVEIIETDEYNDDSITYTTDKNEDDTFTFVTDELGNVNVELSVSIEVYEYRDSED